MRLLARIPSLGLASLRERVPSPLLRIAFVLAGLLAASALLELVSWTSIRSGALAAASPDYGRVDARGLRWQPRLGAWRAPASRIRERTACWDVVYTSNSSGARDVERARRSSEFRVVVLGDAFEGRGVPLRERVSDRLERDTGYEHLNFAVAGGIEASLRVYRELAADYDHAALIVGVTPARDLQPVADDALRPGWRRQLRRFTWSWNALEALGGLDPLPPPGPGADALGRERSLFYDFAEPSARALQEGLARLRRASGARPLALVLVPTLSDLLRYEESDADPLASQLREFGEAAGVRVVNLLPTLAAHARPFERYFFGACGDEHWNAYGNAVAFEYLRDALRGDFYPGEALAQR
jgi:hypothetical protein